MCLVENKGIANEKGLNYINIEVILVKINSTASEIISFSSMEKISVHFELYCDARR